MLPNNSYLQSGKYRILKILGQGGFGITYLAEDLRLGRKIAIKELFIKNICWRKDNRDVAYSPDNADLFLKVYNRFLKEAKHLASLKNPHIINIHDSFEEHNTAYYVMDYIDGINLDEYVKRNGPLSEKTALRVIRQAAEALKYLHDIPMTHFDVKPANLMLVKDTDSVVLIDFGLSVQYDSNRNATTMLPAISNGFSALEMYNQVTSFSPQSDIYSLGATLYFLTTGTIPPSALDIATGEKTIMMNNVPASVQDVISHSMQLSKSARPQNITAFINSLPDSNTNFSPQAKTDSRITSADETTELLSTNNKDKLQPTDNKVKSPSPSIIDYTSEKKNNSFIKILGFVILAIAIIIGILIMGDYIVFWDNVAPISLEVWE